MVGGGSESEKERRREGEINGLVGCISTAPVTHISASLALDLRLSSQLGY